MVQKITIYDGRKNSFCSMYKEGYNGNIMIAVRTSGYFYLPHSSARYKYKLLMTKAVIYRAFALEKFCLNAKSKKNSFGTSE